MSKRTSQRRINSEPWPPPWAALPDTIEGIERGRIAQTELFPEPPRDQTKTGRLARLTAIPGVRTADRLAKGTSEGVPPREVSHPQHPLTTHIPSFRKMTTDPLNLRSF